MFALRTDELALTLALSRGERELGRSDGWESGL
jgi:hypothetical protein